MASPVIINSSSPTSLRLPSITPPRRRDSGKKPASSSEGLPSPSIFVQHKAAGLKSGSRAQAVPVQAGFGFATAGSLWRENKFQQDALQHQPREEERELDVSERKAGAKESGACGDGQKQAAGRLKKPRKTVRTEDKTIGDGTGSITLDFKDFACDDAAGAHSTRRLDMPSPATPVIEAAPPRKNSVNLSEYAFGVYDLGMQTQAPPSAGRVKRSRKNALEKPKKSGDAPPKSRRPNAKSEAVILNSDDAAQDYVKAPGNSRPRKDLSASKEKKPKKRKSSKPASATDGRDLEADKTSRECRKQCSKTVDEFASEKSAYFAAIPAYDIQGPGKLQDCPEGREESAGVQDKSSKHQHSWFAESALPRRTNWTPVKDTEPSHRTFAFSAADSPSHAGSPKVRLADILGGLSHTDAGAKGLSVERSTTGEAVTKRRRIELADVAVAGPSARKAEASPEKSEPKQAKPAGRKKLQTITALATAAYQAALEPSAEQSTVSEFFAPRKETGNEAKEVDTTGKRPTKPRKPRKKKAAAEQDSEAVAAAPKKSKSKKAKVKFNEADHRPKLYTPTRASAQIKQQDFLFGTSSQLAVDESVSFIRDLQAAVEASEKDSSGAQNEVYGSHAESAALQPQLAITPRKGKSCLKIPTAPHGTCLSVGQAHRDLWCVSSRDEDGGFLRGPFKNDAASELHHTDGQSARCSAIFGQRSGHADELGTHEAIAVATNEPAVDSWAAPDLPMEQSQTLDMDLLETRDEAEAYDPTMKPVESDLIRANGTMQQEASLAANDRDSSEDSWMLLSSDGPCSNALRSPPQAFRSPLADHARALPMQNASLVQRVSPIKARSVLQPLNVNASMHVAASHIDKLPEQARAFSTSNLASLPKSPTVKKRGRPRKDANPHSGGVTPLKKRGRPPKRSVIASDPSPEVVKFKKPKATASASQPLQSPSEWLDVDEIYDSDSRKTPSPPRRRASSSPSAVPPLDITVNGSPIPAPKEKASSAVAATASFKLGEPQWPSVREQLFPAISSTVKNAPRSTDSAQPSWYQKILMYDPIVLEELTAWLNEQSLRIQVRRQKPKTKKKGRKKRDAEVADIEQDAESEEEVHEEPLQAWMVQKWCEERSICCVWAGGGWGGRTRH